MGTQTIAPLGSDDPARQQPATPVSSAAPAPAPVPPAPVHSHELTRDEVLELGLIAVEEPHEESAVPEAAGVPSVTPLPPAAVVTPQAVQPEVAEVADDPEEVPVAPPQVVSSQDAPSVPVTPAPSPSVIGDPVSEQLVEPVVTAPRETPDSAPPLTTELTPSPEGGDDGKASEMSSPTTGATAPLAVPRGAVVDPAIGVSANTQSLKSISRLHAVGVVMTIIVILLVLTVAAGGWILYTRLTNGAVSVF